MAATNCAKWRRDIGPAGLRAKGFQAPVYDWKQHEMANFCAKDFAELSAFARAKLNRTPRRKTLVAAFWKQAELPF
jgi:hypothetical protein